MRCEAHVDLSERYRLSAGVRALERSDDVGGRNECGQRPAERLVRADAEEIFSGSVDETNLQPTVARQHRRA